MFGKKYFSFIDGISGYNQVQIHLADQGKTTFTYSWGTFSYKFFPFGPCNSLATFQRVVWSIFLDFVHDKMEIYMDDFTPYGETFEQALINLDKALQRYIEMNLFLSNKKCLLLCDQGIILGHHISTKGIDVDLAKINFIVNLPRP